MIKTFHDRFPLSALGLTLALLLSATVAMAQSKAQRQTQPDYSKLAQPDQPNLGLQYLPNLGQQITPLAPPGSRFVPMNPELASDPSWFAGQAVTTVVSPDQKTLLVLTSGFNRVFFPNGANAGKSNLADSTEFVFIYDISTNTPIKKQVVKIANTYNGIVFDSSGGAFYVAGGASDNVHIITRNSNGTWGEQPGSVLALGHSAGLGLHVPPELTSGPVDTRVAVKPCAAGLAISNDGKTLVVANYYNDSITVFTGGYGNWSTGAEFDLRPGKSDPSLAGVPGGAYPFWVAVKGNAAGATAYVSSIRDREIVVVNVNGAPSLKTRIKVKGQPGKMSLNKAQSRLYVVEDQTDTVDVIDTVNNVILETIPVIAPASSMPRRLAQFTGANPNSVTLSPDEKQLYVTNGNLNCIAVIALDGMNSGGQVVGLIPTGWYPNSVSFSADRNDGKPLSVYVVNGKSPTGPNPGFCFSNGTTAATPTRPNCLAANEYNPQLIKAGFQTFPLPPTAQLAPLTAQVATNNRFSNTQTGRDAAVMEAVRQGVKHVIYIVKENRTYD